MSIILLEVMVRLSLTMRSERAVSIMLASIHDISIVFGLKVSNRPTQAFICRNPTMP